MKAFAAIAVAVCLTLPGSVRAGLPIVLSSHPVPCRTPPPARTRPRRAALEPAA